MANWCGLAFQIETPATNGQGREKERERRGGKERTISSEGWWWSIEVIGGPRRSLGFCILC